MRVCISQTTLLTQKWNCCPHFEKFQWFKCFLLLEWKFEGKKKRWVPRRTRVDDLLQWT